GMIDMEEKLRKFTAACGPVIYRGEKFPEDYIGNAFVCEPSANLVQRNIVYENGPAVVAEQAYENQEFLASTDERFRPVSLYNGPDGNLYLVDMYRGVIQHKTYLTEYLRDQITSRGLEKPLGMGRIYRIKYKENWWEALKGKFVEPANLSLTKATDKELVGYLSHPNGWWRDNAQRLLVERNNTAIIPEILGLLKEKTNKNNNQIHALWTLEGMGVYSPEVIRMGVHSKDPKVVANALRIGERNRDLENAGEILAIYTEVVGH